MNWYIIFAFVLILLLLYILYVYYSNYTTVASNEINLNSSNQPVPVTNNPSSYQYSISAWVYVNSWDNTVTKPLIRIPNQFNLYLDKTTPTLFFDVSQNCSTANITPTPPVPITHDFPLQRWTFVTVVVDNYFVDMYLDGKLLQSIKLNCMQKKPSSTNVNIYLGGNPSVATDIMMTKVYRWSYVLAPQDVWSKYIGGNGITGSISTYGLSVEVLKNNTVQNTIRLF